jgi:hypothetical protein
LTPLTYEQLAEFEIIRDPLMERAANDILARLIAAHKGPKPAQLPFFVVEGDDINCATLHTGGAILCTRALFDQLVAAGMNGKDQLAFLLAHELAHMTIAKHRDRFGKSNKLKKQVATVGLIGALVGLAVFSEYKKAGNQITMQATQGATNVFWVTLGTGLNMSEFANGVAGPDWAKKDEEEADAYAMILLRDAGFDIGGAQQFLATTDRVLRANKMRSTRFGQMFKQAGQGALIQGLLSKGDTLSISIGAVGGALSGWAQEGALAHYHRTPDKRAATCAEFVRAHMDAREAESAVNETEDLFTSFERAATEEPAAAATPRGGRRGKARTPPPPPPVLTDSWAMFLASPGPIAQVYLAERVSELVGDDRPEDAAALCWGNATISRLALYCGIAFAGAGNPQSALPLLARAMADPHAPPETYRYAAQAQASLGMVQIALRTTEQGIVRYPAGELYPDDMMIRAASGDMAGAQATAVTCQAKATKPFQEACARGWASIQVQPTQG